MYVYIYIFFFFPNIFVVYNTELVTVLYKISEYKYMSVENVSFVSHLHKK